MVTENNNAGEGLFVSLKNLTSTFIAIIQTRLELLGTDLEEGRERLISLLVMIFMSLFCLCFGIVLLALLLVVVFWDTHRLLVLSTLTGIFLVAGSALCFLVIRTLKAMPRMFEASLIELSKDQRHINTEHE